MCILDKREGSVENVSRKPALSIIIGINKANNGLMCWQVCICEPTLDMGLQRHGAKDKFPHLPLIVHGLPRYHPRMDGGLVLLVFQTLFHLMTYI